MKLKQIHFEPVAMACFSKDDALILKRCAATHYDSTCKAAGEAGGIIYGIGNAVEYLDGMRSLRWSDVDLLCKVIEFPPPGIEAGALRATLLSTLGTMQRERPAVKEFTHREL